jgi:hypothetical protein
MLILGHTKCTLCREVISENAETFRLPYINPDGLSGPIRDQEERLELALRPYVHKACLDVWQHRELFFQLADALLSSKP